MSRIAQPPHPLLATTREPFLVRSALRDGVPRSHLRAGIWQKPARGVRRLATTAPRSPGGAFLDRCRAVALVLATEVAFSHHTALGIHGVPVPTRWAADERIHVVTTNQASRPQRHGVVAHHSANPVETQERSGLLVTTPAQTWVHLAVELNLVEAVILGDLLTRRKKPLTTVDDLMRIALTTRKVAGIELVRQAARLVRARTDSVPETRARLILVRDGLPCPQVNRSVYDEHGNFVAMPDMSYPEFRIAIDYEGDIHRTDRETWLRDIRRFRALEDLGWIVIRVVTDDVLRDPREFVARVRHALQAAGAQV